MKRRNTKLSTKYSKLSFFDPSMQFSSSVEAAVFLLLRNSTIRSMEENNFIKNNIQSIQYFRNFIQNHGEVNYDYICRYLEAKYYEKDQIVFSQGDVGEEFYIILQGSVGVYVKTTIEDEIEVEREVKILNQGESFGELALLKGKWGKRSATIICKERTALAYFTKEIFNKLIKDSEQSKYEEGLQILLQINLFKNSEEDLVKQFYLFSKKSHFVLNQVVYDQDDPTQNFYIIKSGEFLKYFKQDNQIVKICTISQGEVFGFEELIRKNNFRDHSIKCISSEGSAYTLLNQDFHKRILSNYQILDRLKKMRSSNIKLRNDREKELFNFKAILKNDTLSKTGFQSLSHRKTGFAKSTELTNIPQIDESQSQNVYMVPHKKSQKQNLFEKIVSYPSQNYNSFQQSVDASILQSNRKDDYNQQKLPMLDMQQQMKEQQKQLKEMRKGIHVNDQKVFYGLRDKLEQYQSVKEIRQAKAVPQLQRLTIYTKFFNYEMQFQHQQAKERKNKALQNWLDKI